MFLSIIIPIYNAEKYLEECLDSCLNQDLPGEDYEILCINDGSTDSSAAILDRYARDHSNVRVITQPNGGVSAARNEGIDAACGEYIWFVDADDFIRRDCLAELRNAVTDVPPPWTRSPSATTNLNTPFLMRSGRRPPRIPSGPPGPFSGT